MVYAVIDSENSDILATYSSRAQAEQVLAAYVEEHPDHDHEIGIRPYEGGRPAGEFRSAVDILGERLSQRPLAWGERLSQRPLV